MFHCIVKALSKWNGATSIVLLIIYIFRNNGVETAMIKNINSLIKSPEFSKIIFKIFTEYVERHQKLLKYIEDVDNFFSNYFIVKIGTYVAYVVVILYLMLLVGITI